MADIDERARNFDHHDEGLDNIFDEYREFRQQCPVGRSEKHGGFHFVTRYEDIYRIEQDWETFAVAPSMLLPSFGNKRPMIPIDIDPPMLQKYRRVLLPLFAPAEIDKAEGSIRAVAKDLVDAMASSSIVDGSGAFARPLPMIVFCQMMGLPAEDYVLFSSWIDRIIYERTRDHPGAMAAGEEVYAYFEDFLRQRKGDPPGNDIVGRLLSAEIDGQPLAWEELLDYCYLLVLAALDTTAWTIRSALWYLAGHPEAEARLRADPAMIPAAVEEILRCYSPVQAMARTCTKDIDFNGSRFESGDRVLILFGSGNRDEAEFERADEVLFDRESNRHAAFGIGIHRCLGSNLGRREVKIALEEFIGRIEVFSFPAKLSGSGGPDPVWHGIGPLPLQIGTVQP